MRKAVFWDWTGTLADESRLDAAVCRTMEAKLAKTHGISENQAADRFQSYLQTLENTWRWHDYIQHARHFGLNWRDSQEAHLDKLKLVSDAREILLYARRKGYQNILATNAVRAVITLRLEYAGLDTLFEAVIASDDAGALKAEGRHFACLPGLTAADHPYCFSIGDNPVQDIQPAKKLGIKTILCAFGKELTHYHSPHLSGNHETDADPDFRIQALKEIESII